MDTATLIAQLRGLGWQVYGDDDGRPLYCYTEWTLRGVGLPTERALYIVDAAQRRARRALDYDGWVSFDGSAAGLVAALRAYEDAWRKHAWPVNPEYWLDSNK